MGRTAAQLVDDDNLPPVGGLYCHANGHLPQLGMNLFKNHGLVANCNTTVDQAWSLCSAAPDIQEQFLGQSKIFGWSHPFSVSPFWAYWFARNIVRDEWIGGEDLIMQDPVIWSQYVTYTETMKSVGSIGWTLREPPEFYVNDLGVITGWKPGHGPILGPKKVAKRQPLTERFAKVEEMADWIADQMDEQRRARIDSLGATDDD